MNALVGEKLSIVTSKAQTTRHRILGIVNGDDFQIVFSDTPGILKPAYELHKSMMTFVKSALEDADVILFMIDVRDKEAVEEEVLRRLRKSETPVFVILNKIDITTEEELNRLEDLWRKELEPEQVLRISALHGQGVKELFDLVLEKMPEHPAFYDKDSLTDKPEKFFAAEIIREKIFQHYKQEIPYSSQVVIAEFKEEEKIIRIRAEIYVERLSQKGILIGRGGESLKKIGTQARIDMEKFFGKQVFLEQYVRVDEDWRKHANKLRRFGYNE